MPELPEVETVRRGLSPVMEGAVIDDLELRRPNLRFPFPENFKECVVGKKIVSMGRRAKYLLIDLEDGTVIISHLGMSGSFRIHSASAPGLFHHDRNRQEKHDHVVFHVTDENGQPAKVVYNDPRRFGFMLMANRSELENHAAIKNLGVEPTSNALSSAELADKFKHRKIPLKSALLDQSIVAGLGNIYVCEALWRSGLSPKRQASTLVLKSGKPTARVDVLVDNIKNVIHQAIEAGGSSLRDHAQTDGSLGYFQHSFAVYDQEGNKCQKTNCNGIIRRIVQSGRSTFYCAKCQR